MFVIYFKFQWHWLHINRISAKKRCPKAMKRTIVEADLSTYLVKGKQLSISVVHKKNFQELRPIKVSKSELLTII